MKDQPFLQGCEHCGRWPMALTEEVLGYPRRVLFTCGNCRTQIQLTVRQTVHTNKPQTQLEELKRLRKEVRVPDESKIVTTKEDAEHRIRT